MFIKLIVMLNWKSLFYYKIYTTLASFIRPLYFVQYGIIRRNKVEGGRWGEWESWLSISLCLFLHKSESRNSTCCSRLPLSLFLLSLYATRNSTVHVLILNFGLHKPPPPITPPPLDSNKTWPTLIMYYWKTSSESAGKNPPSKSLPRK